MHAPTGRTIAQLAAVAVAALIVFGMAAFAVLRLVIALTVRMVVADLRGRQVLPPEGWSAWEQRRGR